MDLNNYTLLCDFYELTMANGYFQTKYKDTITYFDLFYRKNPDKGGFVICAGLESVIDYIKNLHFFDDDIEYLRSKGCFCEEFLDYLKDFTFTGDIYAVPEGTPVFPYEPIITVRAKAIEAQLIETYLLLAINHQSLIATKASRIVTSAKGRPVMEFGARRAHGPDAAIYGARAAIIGGAIGTSCSISAKEFDVTVSGTMAHSWIQSFDSEYEAFKTYAEIYPNGCTFLIDTYDTLNSGLVNAIKVSNEVLAPLGARPVAVRLDSGDLAYLSKEARKMLDEAGYPNVGICLSNGLNEETIKSLIDQQAPFTSLGVGDNISASKERLGGVYKLVAVEKDGIIIPKIKVSEDSIKTINPGYKKLYRFYDKETGYALGDVLTLPNEIIDTDEYTLIDPNERWKTSTIRNYIVRELRVPIFINGKQVYNMPSIHEQKKYCEEEFKKIYL